MISWNHIQLVGAVLINLGRQLGTKTLSTKFSSSRRYSTIHGGSQIRELKSIDFAAVGATPGKQEAQTELDSHADTCALGSNFIVLYFTGQQADVTPFSKSYEATKGIQVGGGATAWTKKEYLYIGFP